MRRQGEEDGVWFEASNEAWERLHLSTLHLDQSQRELRQLLDSIQAKCEDFPQHDTGGARELEVGAPDPAGLCMILREALHGDGASKAKGLDLQAWQVANLRAGEFIMQRSTQDARTKLECGAAQGTDRSPPMQQMM